MKSYRIPSLVVIGVFLGLISGPAIADGQLRWPGPRKEAIEVRLIALAVVYPRSSFFANDEVFIAEQELAKSESRFIKLVYDFLPYQSPLSSYGLDYSLVHRFNAVRDTTCDENLWQMRTLADQDQDSPAVKARWKYAVASPIYDLDRRQARLRCYRATSDDYEKVMREPTSEIPY
jgi:hypothetical protein